MIIRNHLLGNLLNGLIKLIFYPIITLGKVFTKSEEKLIDPFIRANNYITYHRQFTLIPNKLLLLLPHCLQNSECNQKITQNINNCKGCGKCQICQIVELHAQYPVHFHIVNGGTMARNRLKSGNYKAVIAVACERELESGIIYSHLPAIAIINERPKGPCIETEVDLQKVDRALRFFLGKPLGKKEKALKEANIC